jgi:rubrerythrin
MNSKLFLLSFTVLVFVRCNESKIDNTVPQNMSHSDKLTQPSMIETKIAVDKTINNMQKAYKGEISAIAKYTAFSKKAEQEGYTKIALLYKAVSLAETIHAKNHKKVIETAGVKVPIISPEFIVKLTKENLHDDIQGEAYEANTMYPGFLKIAKEADNNAAIISLTYAMKTEKKHKLFFEKALGDINSNTLLSLPSVYFVCPICGNTYETEAPNHCDFSNTPKEKFIKINSL